MLSQALRLSIAKRPAKPSRRLIDVGLAEIMRRVDPFESDIAMGRLQKSRHLLRAAGWNGAVQSSGGNKYGKTLEVGLSVRLECAHRSEQDSALKQFRVRKNRRPDHVGAVRKTDSDSPLHFIVLCCPVYEKREPVDSNR